MRRKAKLRRLIVELNTILDVEPLNLQHALPVPIYEPDCVSHTKRCRSRTSRLYVFNGIPTQKNIMVERSYHLILISECFMKNE